MRSVVVDSGFLIGLFDESDPLHPRCRRFLRDYRGGFLTTEAVLTEALALLTHKQQLRCLDWLGDAAQAGLLAVDREPWTSAQSKSSHASTPTSPWTSRTLR